jgi:2'-5' RNA ligase
VSRQPSARLFVAVDPPASVREELADWARAAAGTLARGSPAGSQGALRLLAPDLLHLTLCFLGARPVAELGPLALALEGCLARRCELSLGAPLWLPSRSPRALAVAAHDRDGQLGRLRERVLDALREASDWQPERRRFRAHITVARLGARASSRSREDRAAPLLPATPRLDFPARSLCLYRSRLAPSGARYEPLASCELEQPGEGETGFRGDY